MAQHPAVRAVLAMADSQIGYSRWKDDQRGTKYARETQPVFWPKDLWLLANGISFCDVFVTWVFWKALGEGFVTDGGLPAGASYNTDYRASHGGRVSKPPRPGDVLAFDWNWNTLSTNHVGILEKVLPSGNYQTIEGNTSAGSAGSQGNGGGVYRRTRRPEQVRYVIRPNWAMAGGSSSSPATDTSRPWRTSVRVKAMSTAEVRTIQAAVGVSVDGKYGNATGAAVHSFQTSVGLTADGIAGPSTQEAIVSLARIEAIVTQNQIEIRQARDHAKRGADVATINQGTIRETNSRLAPIRRGGKEIEFRQELADVKTILLGQDLPAIIRAAVADAGSQDPDVLAESIAERLADGLTLTVSATPGAGAGD